MPIEGQLIYEMGTNDIYVHSRTDYLNTLESNLCMYKFPKIRNVSDIVTQVYTTPPSSSKPANEDNVVVISTTKKIYTNTGTTKRWSSKTSVDMPKDRTYLSLADKRIYEWNRGILKFGPLLDGENFIFRNNLYTYRLSTDSFEKDGETVILATTMV